MVAGLLVRLLVRLLAEAADQVLEDVPHLDVRDRVGVQVDLTELRQHHVQAIVVFEGLDLLLDAEILQELPRLPREAVVGGCRLDGLRHVAWKPLTARGCGRLTRNGRARARSPKTDRKRGADIQSRESPAKPAGLRQYQSQNGSSRPLAASIMSLKRRWPGQGHQCKPLIGSSKPRMRVKTTCYQYSGGQSGVGFVTNTV